MTAEWKPDVLGPPFAQRTLPLGTDSDGEVVATLVRREPSAWDSLVGALRDVDVLYVHGWSDCFFQVELARFCCDLGARFHALDLRAYGRSLREGQIPGYVTDLTVYDEDIAAALTAIGHDPASDAPRRRRLVLLGHSTGGLTLTLWAARHPGFADALVLNSPWLELQTGPFARQALLPLIEARARWDPLGAHPEVDLGFYTRAQRETGALPGEAIPAAWRPERGFPTHPGWLRAVVRGHATVAAGIETGCPTLVLLSARSSSPLSWSEQALTSDSVLVVDEIARAATRVGSDVTLRRVDGALHDVFLSAEPARAEAYRGLREWLVDGAVRRRAPRGTLAPPH
ncbi:alpha/beta hydrolase [Microbacterium aurantiacum]|uniref:alpha/beta hydrolase n=1 Tax=Microbacterium aurantiacum TaxID=162393 RepID=UPI00341C3436